MWKLLPVLLLVSCAVNQQQHSTDGGVELTSFRIVNRVELPLHAHASQQADREQVLKKDFHGSEVQGSLEGTGAWSIRATVTHTRLRCATYETGIQLGRGAPECSNVEWLTDVEYGTRQRHCNSAVRIHTGGGEFPGLVDILNESSCVRVVVRCEGTC